MEKMSKVTYKQLYDINPKNSLHELVDKDKWNLENIRNFLESNPSSVYEVNCCGETPLLCVLRKENCSTDVVQLLLAFGADVNCLVKWENVPPPPYTAEFIGIRSNSYRDPKLNPSTLCFAFGHGVSKDVIELLLDADCSTHACQEHFSVLHCALKFPKLGPIQDIIQLLIERGASVDTVDTQGRSLVCFALQNHNDTCTMELLLAAGASFHACTIHATPLFCAVEGAGKVSLLQAEVIKLVLQSGAAMDILNDVDETSLEYALRNCEYETRAIRLLLGCLQGLNPNNFVDELNNSLLYVAVSNAFCKPKTVKILIKLGVQVNTVNDNWETALHMAVRNTKCKLSVLKILLKNGAEVNQANLFNDTPLSIAVENWQNAAILKELLAAGALIKTYHCSSLLDIITNGCDEAVLQPISQSFLRNVANECGDVERRLISFKMLLRYFFLQTSNFDIDDMFQCRKDSEELLRFKNECERELQNMKSKNVGENLTLHEFLSNVPTSPQVGVIRCKLQDYDFFQLMKAIADNAYPLYFDIISAKIDRSLMEKNLQEVVVYTIKYSIDLPCIEEKILLNYKSVCSIAQYLSDDDLLRLILAFFYMSEHPCTSQASTEKSIEDKRSAELTEECCKRQKLHT